ncbi:siderophore-interacting protein [Microbacterium sp. G2-8]|uniref:siderophore-interacting protein n=1 Tax=Microbacterium sp. G2-8 TaxID=2842454 RepID=UPI001C89B40D|nr:siderophore-interacting protein [Microbacterium sp. G2-8]
MNSETPGARRQKAQYVFDVDRTERIAPGMVRVHLGGAAFAAFVESVDAQKQPKTDKYVKLLFAKPELGLEPPYDLDALRETLAPEDMPSRRTYTVRSIDEAAGTMAVDFVVHGDEGIAGPWAASAVPGDRVALMGPGAQYEPSPDVDAHLFFGDESAIPAIAAALESLDAAARGLALIEVGAAGDELDLAAPHGVEVRWIHRDGRAFGVPLVEAVEALPAPNIAVDVFAHGEREAMKRLRPLVHAGWGIDRRLLSLSAYWAHGRAEDTFQAEKRTPTGQIFEPDA